MSIQSLTKRGSTRAIACASAAAGALVVASLLLPSAASPRPAIGTFPPGYWCGIGKAPPGLKIKITSVVVKVEKGVLNFDLLSAKGDSHGSWDALIATNGFTTPKGKADGRFALVGGTDVGGTTVHPQTSGSWDITGKVVVKGSNGKVVVPFEQHVKKWKTPLVIEFSSLDKVKGYWLAPQWKWSARRTTSMKGCA